MPLEAWIALLTSYGAIYQSVIKTENTWYGDCRGFPGDKHHDHHENHEQFLIFRFTLLCLPLGITSGRGLPDERDNDQCVHLATLNSEKDVVAVCTIRRESNEEFRLFQMAVDESLRRSGTGSAILGAITDRARKAGARGMFCHARTYAVPFYTRNGWTVTGSEFQEVGHPHVPMGLVL